jgi:hypothetical protein
MAMSAVRIPVVMMAVMIPRTVLTPSIPAPRFRMIPSASRMKPPVPAPSLAEVLRDSMTPDMSTVRPKITRCSLASTDSRSHILASSIRRIGSISMMELTIDRARRYPNASVPKNTRR